MEVTKISPKEWKLMELLWEKPRSVMEMVHEMKGLAGWSKSTVLTMIKRMENKKLVTFEWTERSKMYSPAVKREQSVAEETDSLLKRAYNGSIGLLVNAIMQRNDITDYDLEEISLMIEQKKKEMIAQGYFSEKKTDNKEDSI